VRISVENPSEPIYGETNGQPHGFNYEFAKLLFGQKEFASNGPIAIDTRHEVSTYKDVPKQLLLSDNGAPTVDIAMDGLTFPDNQPAGVVYQSLFGRLRLLADRAEGLADSLGRRPRGQDGRHSARRS
jgi:hypothetical protein